MLTPTKILSFSVNALYTEAYDLLCCFTISKQKFQTLFSHDANLIFHNTPKINGVPTIKSLFSRETQTTKVPKLFDIHHMLVQDPTMH